MPTDSSLGSASTSFDFETQSGVMHMLASVRASDISPVQKNELRDLIFLYSNGGHDTSVRNSLAQKLAQYAVTAVARTAQSAPAKMHDFGTSRPSPTFSAAPVQVTKEPEANLPTPTPAPTPTPTPAPAPVVSEPAPQANMASPAEVPNNLPQENPAPEPAVPAQAPQTPQAAPIASADESLVRIKEIKALVNQKVGNPVNLVNINNEVGREYMSALLDAMKKINSGSSAASAMQRLESAYVNVEQALKDQPDTKSEVPAVEHTNTQPAPETEPTPTPAAEPVPEPQQAPAEPAAPVARKISPISAEQTQSIASETPMDSQPLAPLTQSEKRTAPESVEPETASEISEPEPQSTARQSTVPQAAPVNGVQSAWGPETDTVSINHPVDESKTAPVSQSTSPAPTPPSAPSPPPAPTPTPPPAQQSASLAQSETKLRTPADLPDPAVSAASDPLFSAEVDDGLNQLLTDWSLFKKSGLFGTGPKGMHHPLYEQLKDLQIPLLLAGRFEGATQEIKQSITDYMNGWRYEQGMVYNPGENFDHYLRRVIRHILDLHKKP
jgi:hypothetical protein